MDHEMHPDSGVGPGGHISPPNVGSPGPSAIDKGKAVDPRNWGFLETLEVDIEAQVAALRNIEKKRKAGSSHYKADDESDHEAEYDAAYEAQEYERMSTFLRDLTSTEYMLAEHLHTLDAAASSMLGRIPGGVYTIRAGYNPDATTAPTLEEFLPDLDYFSAVAIVFLRTWSNQVVVPWLWEDVEEIGTSFQIPEEERNASLRRYFETSLATASLRVFSAPTLFCDSKGNIVLWYIPKAFAAHCQTPIIRATYPDAQFSDWDISQGNEVKVSLTCYDPAGSTDVLHGEEGQRMLSALNDTNRVLACWLSLVHPTLFTQQMNLHKALYSEKCERMLNFRQFIYETYGDWTTPYPGFILSGNQALSPRKDKADIHVFHAILALGSHSGGRIKIPSLGATFDFEPGCAIFFPAAAMSYSVEAAPSGQRIVMKTYCDTQLGWKAMGREYALGLRRPTLDSVEEEFNPHRLIPAIKQELITSGNFPS
ncbi:hypothetical protein H1R20_g7459, partial [Candolleomyces eurysporus]